MRKCVQDFTGIHKGKRFVIGGGSPFIQTLPRDILSKSVVIGINRWPCPWGGEVLPCNYWIGSDTGLNWKKYRTEDDPRYQELPKFLQWLDVPLFMRKPNRDTEAFVPPDAGIFFEKAPKGVIPEKWTGQLVIESSTAMSAINLAIIMGASEILLYGVDFVGSDRADGTRYHTDQFWDDHRHGINNLMRRFTQMVPVYKTHPESWLECELMRL